MKKLFVILVAVVTGVAAAMAQEAIAMLKQGTTTKTYTGFKALQNAYKEAKNGDLITLSSGTFGAVGTIEKNITIRGAGMQLDKTYNTQPTIVDGNFTIAVATTEGGYVTIEGIYHEGTIYYGNSNVVQKNPRFIKCRLGAFINGTYSDKGTTYVGVISNAYFLHCKIVDKLSCNSASSMTLINCYVYDPNSLNKTTSSITFRNCEVRFTGQSHLYSCRFINSILNGGGNPYVNDYTSFQRCVLPSSGITIPVAANSSCWTITKYEELFKTFKGTYQSTEAFELLDDVKKKYVDEYGREVGINGGTFPFSARMAGPHIKSMEVGPRSTADGKLNVKMTIVNTGY